MFESVFPAPYLWAGGTSVSGLARSAVVTLWMSENRRYCDSLAARCPISEIREHSHKVVKGKKTKGNIRPLQLCQGVQGGHGDQEGP